jgi:hypothetical protein
LWCGRLYDGSINNETGINVMTILHAIVLIQYNSIAYTQVINGNGPDDIDFRAEKAVQELESLRPSDSVAQYKVIYPADEPSQITTGQ